MKDEYSSVWSNEVLSTRLFPKGLGADRYQITGIARYCDWVLLSDRTAPHTHLVKQAGDASPRHIFVSMRNAEAVLPTLRQLLAPMRARRSVTLILASEDWTFPVQMDRRRPFYPMSIRQDIIEILSSPAVREIFVENLDTAGLARVTPIPLGIVFPENADERSLSDVRTARTDRGIESCPATAFCGHRIRKGDQWLRREKVSALVEGPWSGFCTSPGTELTEAEFFDATMEHSFVICVEGGGLDPSPKAWQTLLHGRIPIIRRSPATDAYREFPVLFVDDWTEAALSAPALSYARSTLLKHFTDPARRQDVLQRLTMAFWRNRILGDCDESGDLSRSARSALPAT
ncbi:hypothetical protein JQU17_04595 [Ponticoccus sp. SC2-23]|uniref:hypothetical protein n=1 Tax=Alexandriicola marinus TaxID=2081710 RepID=UPI000FDA44C0|nr:hypothetical protein [Alexandriicola marinus]MBM1219466.1 hypothetical protein [Ponticoccus sp. SC6-9]MBM1223462.1 hypothetical protein [Ponticoccus sp. SC6-15]MBM1229279.1 hypothetical protein [Ponticoccus sp. SC6-38]MBM1232428.1 hypothetical protein [Ponticoccus sp. SC6-45]MBM1237622.1 hypothetical protein [Ponticoccus sp. SC6-49]MBM1241439.1 hypothetical protein [Ponticoccus sp. SC2-64]MBM1245952.1 hypothetical protein [Ponticoccus sp. SC6-42]MBM1250430.1 hypothetical protein [Pontico